MTHDYFITKQAPAALRSHAIRGATITIIAQFLSFAISTIGTIILARILTPDDFGLVTMALSASLLLQNFGFNGFTEAIIQKSNLNHFEVSNIFWLNFAASCALAAMLICSGPLISSFYKDMRLNAVLAIISSSIVFVAISTEHMALLNRALRFTTVSMIALISTLLSTLLAILMAYKQYMYWSLVMRWVSLPLFTAIASWILCRWRPSSPNFNTNVMPLIKYGISTYCSFVVTYLKRNIDKVLIGRFAGPAQLGFYDRAYHLAHTLPSQLISPVANVAIATWSRVANDQERYRKMYLHIISIIAFIGMLASAIMTLNGPRLVLLLLGPQWHTAGILLSLLSTCIGIMFIYYTNSWLHLSLGTPNKMFRWGLFSLAITVIFLLLGIRYGVIGLAVSYTLSYYVLAIPALCYAGRPFKLTYKDILSVLWRYWIAAMLSCGICLGFLYYCSASISFMFNSLHLINKIVVSSCACTAIYLLLITILFKGPLPIVQFVSLIKEMAMPFLCSHSRFDPKD